MSISYANDGGGGVSLSTYRVLSGTPLMTLLSQLHLWRRTGNVPRQYFARLESLSCHHRQGVFFCCWSGPWTVRSSSRRCSAQDYHEVGHIPGGQFHPKRFLYFVVPVESPLEELFGQGDEKKGIPEIIIISTLWYRDLTLTTS